MSALHASPAADDRTPARVARLLTSTRSGPWLAALGGALWCALYIGPLIDPSSLDGVFRDDWAQHTLGWLFYRHERAGFPLGKIRSFLHPVGTTLGYMDSIPWVALLLRPLSKLLPRDFQYLGLWLLLCSGSLAYVAARIMAKLTPHWEQQALAGMFVAMAPTLITRFVHPALCAHAFIVAAIGFNLVQPASRKEALQALWVALGVVLLGTATHPYFAVMGLLIAIGAPLRLRELVGVRVALAFSAAMLLGSLVVLLLLGYIGGRAQNALDGFGEYSANLNTFINSMDHSRLFKGLDTARQQYEGYCYLGAGAFLLVLIALATLALPATRARIRQLPWRRARWPLIAAAALAVYALATPIRWGHHELLRIPLYAPFDSLNQSFRSSGRFIWPLAYALNLAALATLLCSFQRQRLLATSVLALGVAVQAYDLDLKVAKDKFTQKRENVFDAPEWSLAHGKYRHLVLYPTEIMNACEPPQHYRGRLVTELAYLAYKQRWTFNSGYAARYTEQTKQECARLQKQVTEERRIGADEVFVVAPRDLRALREAGAVCGHLDRLYACVQPSDEPFAQYLRAHPKGPAKKLVLR